MRGNWNSLALLAFFAGGLTSCTPLTEHAVTSPLAPAVATRDLDQEPTEEEAAERIIGTSTIHSAAGIVGTHVEVGSFLGFNPSEVNSVTNGSLVKTHNGDLVTSKDKQSSCGSSTENQCTGTEDFTGGGLSCSSLADKVSASAYGGHSARWLVLFLSGDMSESHDGCEWYDDLNGNFGGSQIKPEDENCYYWWHYFEGSGWLYMGIVCY